MSWPPYQYIIASLRPLELSLADLTPELQRPNVPAGRDRRRCRYTGRRNDADTMEILIGVDGSPESTYRFDDTFAPPPREATF